MKPYYRLYKDTQSQFRWTFFAGNGKRIADSGEGYHNKQDCLNGLNLIKASAGAEIRDETGTSLSSLGGLLGGLGDLGKR